MTSRSRTLRKPLAVDLFSGCGGLTTGIKRAGFFVVGAVDNDLLAVETYKANHPEVRVWCRNITNVSAPDLRRKLKLRRGELALLAGCPPCQAFSTLRTLNGKRILRQADKDLLFQFLRFARALKPEVIMIENVPGLAHDRRIVKFCGLIARIGYQSEIRLLDAADYGVPQRRRRMILLASRTTMPKFARRVQNLRTVRACIGVLPPAGKSGDPLHDLPEKRSARMMLRIKRTPRNGGSRSDLPSCFRLMCHRRCSGFKDVYGRMAWDNVAPTITTGCFNPSKGRFLHPRYDRAITMREAALLQGFPKRYKFFVTHGKTAIAAMIGNALPPPFITAHVRQAYRVLA